MRRGGKSRPGAVLLEVIIAIAILAASGGAIATLAVDAGHVMRLAQDSERNLAAASALMDHVALWSADELDRHLGEHPQGPWRLDVTRPSAALYVVTLRGAHGKAVVATTLYRAGRKGPEGASVTH